MKYLIKTLGGSTAYGLNTPESDVDYRGVFMNTEPAKILGLSRFDGIQKQETEDEVYFELRKFFELLKDGNTGALEILFTSEKNILSVDDTFLPVLKNRTSFVDTEKMYRCLLGYMLSERRLANGERTGQLGGKRKAQLDKYGFSPKNFINLYRLSRCGRELFSTGIFPVNLKNLDPIFCDELMDIRLNPENYNRKQLNERAIELEHLFKDAYETRLVTLKFNVELANDLLRRLYLPFLM